MTGEAGAGKTSLAEYLALEAEALGARVLTGRCREGAGVPCLPFVEMLEVVLADPQRSRPRLGPDAAQLARFLPRLRTVVPDIPAPLDLPPEQERRFLWSRHGTEQKGKSEQIIAKNIAGFMNAESGTLLIGVADDGTITALRGEAWGGVRPDPRS